MRLLCAATGWEWGRLAGIQTDTGEVLFAILVGLSALICLYLPFSDAVLRLFFGAVLLFWLLVRHRTPRRGSCSLPLSLSGRWISVPTSVAGALAVTS